MQCLLLACVHIYVSITVKVYTKARMVVVCVFVCVCVCVCVCAMMYVSLQCWQDVGVFLFCFPGYNKTY